MNGPVSEVGSVRLARGRRDERSTQRNPGPNAGGERCREHSGSRPAAAAVALLLLVALGVRVHNLGKHGFWTDELFHAIGAQSMLEIGTPVVPGMMVYERAYPFTKLVSISFEYFGVSEVAGRIPSVFFNLLFLVVGYLSVRYLFNPYLAILFLTVMALAPLEVIWARECRMYALFQLMYFGATVLFFLGFEPSVANGRYAGPCMLPRLEKWLDVNVTLLAASAALFFLALRIHELAYNAVFPVAIYCATMTAVVLFGGKGVAVGRSKYFLAGLSILAGGLWLIIRHPDFVAKAVNVIRDRPFWDTRNVDYTYYVKYLFLDYPLFTLIYPAGAYLIIRKYGRTGIFVVCLFLPLMVMHSFLFVNNIDERYIFYIFPFFALSSAAAIEWASRRVFARIRGEFDGGRKRNAALGGLVMAVLIGVASYPWVGRGAAVGEHAVFEDWKSVQDVLREISSDGIIVSTRRMPLYFYMGRNPDYVIIKSFEGLIREQRDHPPAVRPRYLDVGWLFTKKELSDVVDSRERVYFVVDAKSFHNPAFLDDGVRSFVERHGTPVRHSGDRNLFIYRLQRGAG